MAAKLAKSLKRNPSSQALRRGTELLEACIGHEELAKYLIKFKNYDPNWTDDVYGNSILHHLVYCNHVSMIRFLVESGASIDSKNANGATPLHWAAMLNHLEAAELLLRLKASLDEVDLSGSSPLHLAADCGHPEMVQLFLRTVGAFTVISCPDKDGVTAIELAFQKKTENHKAAYVLLKRFYRSNNISLPKLVGSGSGSGHDNGGHLDTSTTTVAVSAASKPTSVSRPVSASNSGPRSNNNKNNSNNNKVTANDYYNQHFQNSAPSSPILARSFEINEASVLNDTNGGDSSNYILSRNGSRVLAVNNDKNFNNLGSLDSPLGKSFGDQSEFNVSFNEDELFFFNRSKLQKSIDLRASLNSHFSNANNSQQQNPTAGKRPFFIRSLSSNISLLDASTEKLSPPSPEKLSFPDGPKIDLMEDLNKQLLDEYNSRPKNINYLKSGKTIKQTNKPVRSWQTWIEHVRSEFEPAPYTPWTPISSKHLDVIVTVEHCADCHLHTWSLWHNGDKYRNVADEMLDSVLDVLLESKFPIRVFAMKVKPEPCRIGALEVTINIRLNQNETVLAFNPHSNSNSNVGGRRKKEGEKKILENEWISHTLHSKLESLTWPTTVDVRRATAEFVSCTLKPIIYMSSYEPVVTNINDLDLQRQSYLRRTTRRYQHEKECSDVVFTTDKVMITGRILDLYNLRSMSEDIPIDKLEKAMLEHFLVWDWRTTYSGDIRDFVPEEKVTEVAFVEPIKIADLGPPIVAAPIETKHEEEKVLVEFEEKIQKTKNLLNVLHAEIEFEFVAHSSKEHSNSNSRRPSGGRSDNADTTTSNNTSSY